MSFCGRCCRNVWFPCRSLQSELSCKHKGEPQRGANDAISTNSDSTQKSGGFFSTIADAFSGDGGGSCGSDGGCGGGGE